MKDFFVKLYYWMTAIWLLGVLISTPYFTASRTIDLCKTHDPYCLDKGAAAMSGVILGMMWPVTIILGWEELKKDME